MKKRITKENEEIIKALKVMSSFNAKSQSDTFASDITEASKKIKAWSKSNGNIVQNKYLTSDCD